MLHIVTTGAYYPPVVTTWKILTTGSSQLTAGALCSGPCLKSVTLDYSAIQQDFFLSGNQRKVFFLLVSSITEVGYFSSSAQITDGFAHRVGWLVRWLADPAQMAASRFATVTRLPSYAAQSQRLFQGIKAVVFSTSFSLFTSLFTFELAVTVLRNVNMLKRRVRKPSQVGCEKRVLFRCDM